MTTPCVQGKISVLRDSRTKSIRYRYLQEFILGVGLPLRNGDDMLFLGTWTWLLIFPYFMNHKRAQLFCIIWAKMTRTASTELIWFSVVLSSVDNNVRLLGTWHKPNHTVIGIMAATKTQGPRVHLSRSQLVVMLDRIRGFMVGDRS